MRKSTMQVILTASILIFSSLAGCLGTEDDDDEPYIMTSTYHVGQLVSAIVGDTMNVEVLSPSNVPVHDYEPSATDLVRLKESDMFFYHGLGLETWVDSTLDSLGDDKPTSFSTHALPTGETALDYEGILLRELCEHMGEGPYEASYLSEEEGHADDVELHAEHVTHVLKFPGHDDHDHADDNHADDDHDDHDHADDDHADDDPDDHEHADDDHADDEHDDHDHADDDHDDHSDRDDHDGHNHAKPMKKMEEVTGCPEDTVVYIYELEEGEYVLEFEIEDEDHSTFDMVVLKMGGAHAHHDHGDHGDEHDDDHSEHGDHGDEHDDDHSDHGDHGDEHDDDHSDHGDDHDDHESEMVCYDMSTHTVDMTLTTQTDCEAAGLMWTESRGDGDHDDHDEEMTPEMVLERFDTNNDSMLSWDEFMEGYFEDEDHADGEEHDDLEEAMEEYVADMMSTLFNESDTNSDALLNVSELYIFMESMEEAEDQLDNAGSQMMIWMFDEDGDGQLSIDEFTNFAMESDGGDTNATEMAELMFSMFDTDSNGFVNMSELSMLMDMGDEEEDIKGYATIHIEAEGEYGFAIPHDVEMFILSEGDGHDGHSDHDDHGDHDDHSDHDDHGDEEALAYDPHSWLDPVAFKAQASIVLEELKKAYPDLADTFQSNADAFMMSLDKIDTEYKAAFGDGGTCAKNSVAANHNAYAYIAYRYDIEFVTVHGIDPEGEPSAADITKVVEKIGEDEISVLFVEEYTDVSAVNSIVDQTKSSTMPDGVLVLKLYTMELPPKDSNEDYLSLMQKNLDNLKTGLSC